MKIGMLWFDNSKDDFKTKVVRAMEYYETKYGEKPNALGINRKQPGVEEIPGLKIIPYTGSIWINHFWIGKE